MKALSLLALACLCAPAASAQTAFTVAANDTTYSFPLSSTITLTDNEPWSPDASKPATSYKSAWHGISLIFQSSFSTVSQSNKTGVASVQKSRLVADSLWAVDFTVEEPKRVVFAAYAKDTLAHDSVRISCDEEYFGQMCGKTNSSSTGLGYKMFNFGTAGQWTFLYNEKLRQFAFVNTIDGSPNYALMKDTIVQKVDYSKTIDIDNVSDTWSAKACLDGVWQEVDLKLKADPVPDKALTLDGIAYSVNEGRTRIKFPLSYFETLYGYFPDEYDKVKNETNPDFSIPATNIVAEEPTECLALTAGDTINVASPASVSSQENWGTPTLKVLDGNRFEFENGLVMCKWRYEDSKPKVLGYLKVPAGTVLYRSSAYPEDASKTDTVYVVKHDTVVVYLKDVPTADLAAAAKEAEYSLNTTSGTYGLDESKFKEYASYYNVALAKDTAGLTADSLASWKQTLETLRKVATSHAYHSQKLVSPSLTGKYLCLGQGNVATGMLFNRRTRFDASTYENGYIMGNASGYVAYAKRGVSIADTVTFKANAKGKHFNEVTMMGAPAFYGIDTVDAYVIYNPNLDKYIPIYVAAKGCFMMEQWKGNTANNYATLEEAVGHLGPNTMNMADRIWLRADYDDDGIRTTVVNGKTSLDELYASYKDFSVIATCGGATAKLVLTEGVTIDTSTTPFTFTKDGEACDFSGVALLKASTTSGDPVVLAITLQQKKLYAYAYDINE